jgi:hypothetical protein
MTKRWRAHSKKDAKTVAMVNETAAQKKKDVTVSGMLRVEF